MVPTIYTIHLNSWNNPVYDKFYTYKVDLSLKLRKHARLQRGNLTYLILMQLKGPKKQLTVDRVLWKTQGCRILLCTNQEFSTFKQVWQQWYGCLCCQFFAKSDQTTFTVVMKQMSRQVWILAGCFYQTFDSFLCSLAYLKLHFNKVGGQQTEQKDSSKLLKQRQTDPDLKSFSLDRIRPWFNISHYATVFY